MHSLSLKQESTDRIIQSLKTSNAVNGSLGTSLITHQKLDDDYLPVDGSNKTIEKLEEKLLRKKFVLSIVSFIRKHLT